MVRACFLFDASSVPTRAHVTSLLQQHVDQRGDVRNIHVLVSVDIGLGRSQAGIVEQIVDQCGHVSNVDCMVMVHIAKLVFGLFLTVNGHDNRREAALLVHVESNLGSIAFPCAVVAASGPSAFIALGLGEVAGSVAIHAVELNLDNGSAGRSEDES